MLPASDGEMGWKSTDLAEKLRGPLRLERRAIGSEVRLCAELATFLHEAKIPVSRRDQREVILLC